MKILISKLKNELKIIFKGYSGFKLFISSAILIAFILFYIPIFTRHGINLVVVRYNYYYWLSSPTRTIALFAIVLSFILIFWLDILQNFYSLKYKRYRKNERDKRIHRITRLVSLLSLILVVVTVPFIALYFPDYLAWLLNFIIIATSVLQYGFLFKETSSRKYIPSLSNFVFNHKYFDVASLSNESLSIEQELNYCHRFMSGGPSHANTHEFINRGNEKTSWRGIETFFQNMSQLFNVPPDDITLHDRTYDALEYTFEEIFSNIKPSTKNPITIVTTDSEYYRVKEELFPNLKSKYKVNIEEYPLNSKLSSHDSSTSITTEFINFCNNNNPKIIFCSHVLFSTGFILDIERIATEILKSNPHICIVIDGAQSLGNIDVNDSIFTKVSYYATSAHKWLLAPASLGILIKNLKHLQDIGFKHFRKPIRPHSFYPIKEERSGVTHSYDPYFGLNAIISKEFLPLKLKPISEHNLSLSKLLQKELVAIDIPYSNINSYSSIVTIHLDNLTRELHRRLGTQGFISSLISLDTNRLEDGYLMRNNYVIRFCNHYFHSEDDIYDLVENIESELIKIRKNTDQYSFSIFIDSIKNRLPSRETRG